MSKAKGKRAKRRGRSWWPASRLLTLVPLKDAIRTGALAREWRNLWKTRWDHRSAVEIYLRSGDKPQKELDALEREPRPRRRLDRFSLTVNISTLKAAQLRRFLDYAAECNVEDLQVEMQRDTKLNFHLPLSSPILARLSLRNIGVSNMFYKGAQPFHGLRVIRLHSVSISQAAFKNMIKLCPSLLTLHLSYCKCDRFFYSDESLAFPPNLRSVTVVVCHGTASLNSVSVPCLRSFRYSGSFLNSPFSLPSDAMIVDLYIRFCYAIKSRSRVAKRFNDALPDDLSSLTVLTICSNALSVASSLSDDVATAEVPKLSNLHSLRELQILMENMECVNLADLYLFLKTCQCTNLERLFVQLPRWHYGPGKSSRDEMGEQPLEDVLDNLKIVKVVNFSWCPSDVLLVSFLLRKARSLHKLLVFSRNVASLDMSMPGVQEADLLLLKEAVANGKIMLNESDASASQPHHSDDRIY